MTPIPRALVVIPTHDHGAALGWSTQSALGQSVADLEIAIVGDGMTDETREVAHELARRDPRVRVHDLPKAPSRGELHRHAILAEARAPVVCYLSDDDLWLEDHVERLLALLADHDFASVPALSMAPSGTFRVWFTDLAAPFCRDRQVGGENRIPLSCAAHTLRMYRHLPHGWRETPPGLPTDLYMWQQILGQREVRATSGFVPTVINFPSPLRRGWSAGERAAELAGWAGSAAETRERVQSEVLHWTLRELIRQESGIEGLRQEAALRAHEVELGTREAALGAHESELGARESELRTREAELCATRAEEMLLSARESELRATQAEEMLLGARESELRATRAEEMLARFAGTRTWRLREAFFRLPGLGWLLHHWPRRGRV